MDFSTSGKTGTMSNMQLSDIVSAIVRRNAERKSRAKMELPSESATLPQPQKKKTPPPMRVSLAGISKSAPAVSAAISERSRTPPTKGKKTLSKENFPLRNESLKEFLKMHQGIGVFLGERMETFFQKLDEKFFQWLNYQKNSEKMMYEIKKEFMIIADALLLFEVMNEQRKQTPTGFVIGHCKFASQIYNGYNSSISQSEIKNDPFQKILTSFADTPPAEDLFILDDLPEDVRFDSMYPQPYSKPLLRKPLGLMEVMDGCSEQVSNLSEILPPMPDLDDTRRHIFEMEMELAGVAGVADMADTETDVSSFFK